MTQVYMEKLEAVPVAFEGIFDDSPNRIGRRMIWKFTYQDGSSVVTYNARKGLKLRQLMFKGVL